MVADGPKIKQILYNLVSNAIKFSSDGSRVEIGARRSPAVPEPKEGEGGVLIWVRDFGIGIEPEDQEAIFGEFHQVDGEATRAHGGTGLGLTLAKRFAEMHGGSVEVESTPGEGSVFRVRLPLDASREVLLPRTAEFRTLGRDPAAESPPGTTALRPPLGVGGGGRRPIL